MQPKFTVGETVRVRENVPGPAAGRKARVRSVIPVDREAGRFGYAVETVNGFHRIRVVEAGLERMAPKPGGS